MLGVCVCVCLRSLDYFAKISSIFIKKYDINLESISDRGRKGYDWGWRTGGS